MLGDIISALFDEYMGRGLTEEQAAVQVADVVNYMLVERYPATILVQ